MQQKPTYDAGLIDEERINRHGCVEMWKSEKSERRSARLGNSCLTSRALDKDYSLRHVLLPQGSI